MCRVCHIRLIKLTRKYPEEYHVEFKFVPTRFAKGVMGRWKGEAHSLTHMSVERARLLRARCGLRFRWIFELRDRRSPVQTAVLTHCLLSRKSPTLQAQVEEIEVADGARQQQSAQRGAEFGLQGMPLHQGVPGPPIFQPRSLRHRRRLRAARRAHVRSARGRVRVAAKGQHQTLPRRLPQGTLANYRCIH